MSMKRRDLLIGVAATGAVITAQDAAAMGEPKAVPQDTKSPPKTFVLVHGAWHGGWCWRHVADILRGAGHRVFTPTLTGMGARHHLATTDTGLDTHIQDIQNVLRYEELSDVIIVGHSYGGPVCQGVYSRAAGQISKVVMLDAVVLEEGAALMSVSPAAVVEGAKASLIDGALLPSWPPEAFGVLPEDGAAYDWVKRRLTSMPFASLSTPLDLVGGPKLPPETLYISCDGRPFGDDSKTGLKTAQARGWQTASIDTGHDAMVTAPEALADMLIDAA